MNYVVYSHSEFSDILGVQTDYLRDVRDKFLFINKSDLDISLSRIMANYKDIIFYDDSKPYANRLIECFEQLKSKHKIEYCLFTHDIDIIFKKDQKILDNCLQIMKDRQIHRVDLQYDWNANDQEKLINLETFQIDNQLEKKSYYMRKDAAGDYAYNVNPSIWKIEYFLNLLRIDNNLGYRQIELDKRIQTYAKRVVKAHKLKSTEDQRCITGYFCCLPFYIFFHITHGGKLVPLDQDHRFFPEQSHYDVKAEYCKILEKYNLSSKRGHN